MDRPAIIQSPQVPRSLAAPIKRNVVSVEGAKRQEANKKLIDYYRANPVKGPSNINVIEYNKENGSSPAVPSYIKKPPMPMKYERLVIPHYAPPYIKPSSVHANNPIRQVGRAVLERPHYHVMPQWWG